MFSKWFLIAILGIFYFVNALPLDGDGGYGQRNDLNKREIEGGGIGGHIHGLNKREAGGGHIDVRGDDRRNNDLNKREAREIGQDRCKF